MSYQVLARKWRPRTFAQMVGQEHVLRALVNGLDSDRLHHAYLFTGTRGVGKTSLARILAKCLNCERGISSEPCGECSACQEIAQGRFVDLIEVDAASRTKVEDTRDLLDNVQYAPTRGRYKVYLIDEIHMLSGHSFNALLKTLEEPPPHVKFLLATTDPQKIPVTILSRCLQFNLKRLPVKLISDHLQEILQQEGVESEAGALTALAQAADGSMRDALSLLDQAIAFGSGAVREAETRAMLGSIGRDFLYELLEALGEADGAALLAVIERMAVETPDFGEALAELLSLLHTLALAQTVPESLTDDLPQRERALALASTLAREDVQLFYQIALIGRRDLSLAPDPRIGFEMVMLRMLAFRPVNGSAAGAAVPSAAPAASTRPPAPAVREPTGAGTPGSKPPVARAEGVVPNHGAPAANSPAAQWHELVESLGLKGPTRALAMHFEWVAHELGRVQLRLDPGHAHLRNEGMEQRLAQALGKHFGETLRLDVELAAPQGEVPAALSAQQQEQRRQAAVETINRDPNVAAMREAFGAEVIVGSIEPIE
jgi:DNA polymerase III subunit gamma/tau